MRIRLRLKNGTTPEPGKSRFQSLPVEWAFGEEIEIHRLAMTEAKGQRRSSVEAISHLLQRSQQRPQFLLVGREDVTPEESANSTGRPGIKVCNLLVG